MALHWSINMLHKITECNLCCIKCQRLETIKVDEFLVIKAFNYKIC